MTDLIYEEGSDNMGGAYALHFVPVVGITSLPTPASPVQFATGYRWFTIYGTDFTKEFEEEQSTTDNGPLWTISVKLFLPSDSLLFRTQLAEMALHRFLVEIEDNAGLKRRIGTRTETLELRYRFGTGSQPGDRRGTAITFSGTFSKPSVIVN